MEDFTAIFPAPSNRTTLQAARPHRKAGVIYSSSHFVALFVARARAREALLLCVFVCICVTGSLLFQIDTKSVVILLSLSPGPMLSGLFAVGTLERSGEAWAGTGCGGRGDLGPLLRALPAECPSFMEGQELRSRDCGHLLGVLFSNWSFSSEGSISSLIC